MSYAVLLGVIIIWILLIWLVAVTTEPSTTDPPTVENYVVESNLINSELDPIKLETIKLETIKLETIKLETIKLEAIVSASNRAKIIMILGSESKIISALDSKEIQHQLQLAFQIEQVDSLESMLKLSHYKIPLENGYPVYTGDICFFSDAVLAADTYPMTSEQIILPPTIPATINSSNGKIPKIIHQTFETLVVPKPLAQCSQQWRNLNPDYTWKYWTAVDRRQFIQANFDPAVLQAYDDLYPGAFKADLWRCCAIYVEGGVYADIKLFPLVPLYQIMDPTDDIVLTLDFRTYGIIERYIYNAFFAFPARHPLLKIIIDRIVNNVQRRLSISGPTRILDITGPGVWRDAVRIFTHRDYGEGIDYFPTGERVKILGHSFNLGHPCTIVNGKNEHVILAQPPHHLPSVNYWQVTGKKRYDRSPIYNDILI